MSTHKPFHFKQFSVAHDQCAMKVGTDGVLLGAWTSLNHNPNSILDIGTGTGIIALQLAQRSITPTIDAIELDDAAYEQATQNFENSSWGDRLFCYHAHLYEFAAQTDETYDLIVCNPPFYRADFKSDDDARNQARFEDALPFDLLVGAVAKLLSSNGIFSLILPYEHEEGFTILCSKAALFPTRVTHLKGNPDTGIKRCLMEFSFRERETPPIPTSLTIEHARHDYTHAYQELVKDFYLKM